MTKHQITELIMNLREWKNHTCVPESVAGVGFFYLSPDKVYDALSAAGVLKVDEDFLPEAAKTTQSSKEPREFWITLCSDGITPACVDLNDDLHKGTHPKVIKVREVLPESEPKAYKDLTDDERATNVLKALRGFEQPQEQTAEDKAIKKLKTCHGANMAIVELLIEYFEAKVGNP